MVVVRLAALIRRSQRSPLAVVNCGSLAYDTTVGTISLDGLPITLTALEARVLRYLIQKQGRSSAASSSPTTSTNATPTAD